MLSLPNKYIIFLMRVYLLETWKTCYILNYFLFVTVNVDLNWQNQQQNEHSVASVIPPVFFFVFVTAHSGTKNQKHTHTRTQIPCIWLPSLFSYCETCNCERLTTFAHVHFLKYFVSESKCIQQKLCACLRNFAMWWKIFARTSNEMQK